MSTNSNLEDRFQTAGAQGAEATDGLVFCPACSMLMRLTLRTVAAPAAGPSADEPPSKRARKNKPTAPAAAEPTYQYGYQCRHCSTFAEVTDFAKTPYA
jgi:hypothetical protein